MNPRMLMVSPIYLEMGVWAHFDYADEGSDFKDRLTRCYELASRAFAAWLSVTPPYEEHGLPSPMRLVHGIWSSPETRDNPIAHAWVEMDDESIWEPISANLYEPGPFAAFTLAEEVKSYSMLETRLNMVRSGHHGPWHG